MLRRSEKKTSRRRMTLTKRFCGGGRGSLASAVRSACPYSGPGPEVTRRRIPSACEERPLQNSNSPLPEGAALSQSRTRVFREGSHTTRQQSSSSTSAAPDTARTPAYCRWQRRSSQGTLKRIMSRPNGSGASFSSMTQTATP